jgi:Arylsulfotransferase (ASST)
MRRLFCRLAAGLGTAASFAGTLAAAASFAGGASAASPVVSAFPSPGTHYAMPATQIAFRGVPAGGIGPVSVVGSQSGNHTGHIAADSDGAGGSFLPDHPFIAGELVTVTTGLNIAGASNGDFQFTVATPATPIKPIPVAHVPGRVQHFRSRPDLQPPAMQVLKRATGGKGDVFVAPQYGPAQDGPMLLDTAGNVLWFYPVPTGQLATDFRVQQLGTQPVLTWWQGYMNHGSGRGEEIIFNRAYQQIGVVNAANGLQGTDLHEFLLTPQGDAYIVAVQPLVWPGTRKPLMNSVVQEIDVKTGLVLFEWDALDHVPVSASYYKTPKQPGFVWDPFHVNSVVLDRDGNLIVSMRNTWGTYKINHSTGAVMWTLGTSKSSFRMGSGTRTAFQHAAVVQPDGLLTMFDDGAGPPRKEGQSRALTISLNLQKMTATLVRQYTHRPGLSSNYEGNAQPLPGGDVLVGWGQQPYFTEFNSRGQIDYDVRFASATDSYRAYRFPWSAQPPTLPAIAISRGRRSTTAYASWNGATNVSAFRVLAGSSPSKLSPLRTVRKRGFETALFIRSTAKYFAVQALGAKAHVLATSQPIT